MPAADPSRFGLELLNRLVRTLRVVALHQIDNRATEAALGDLWSVLEPEVAAGETVRLRMVDEVVYLGRDPLKLDEGSLDNALNLRRIFTRFKVDEIAFGPTLTRDNLRLFFAAFQQASASGAPENLAKELAGPVRLRALQGGAGTELTARQALLRQYARLVVFAEQDASRHPMPVERFRRVLQGLAETVGGHEGLLVGLTRALRPPGHSQFHHRATVAVLTLLLTRRLGVSRTLQLEAALTGMQHERVGAAPDNPALSAVLQLLEPPASPVALTRALVIGEAGLDLNGVPGKGPPGVLARLMAVPCAFDQLTFPADGRLGLRADRALRAVVDQAGQRYDPRVVRLFVGLLGVFPVGCLVRLSDGRLAVVVEAPKDLARSASPTVRVVDAEGGVGDHLLDLASAEQALTIAETVDPAEHGVNPPHFLLA